ncbi:MAG: HD domain-containing protein [Patescibacteria group bacterium]
MQPIYSQAVQHAMEFAAMKHEGQWRKHPYLNIPFISHPASVGLMLARAGYNDDVVVAGILHDVIEDCKVTAEQMADQFGEKVAQLVVQVSQPQNMTWMEKKEFYRKTLDVAQLEALAIAAADHTYNIHTLVEGMTINPRMRMSFEVTLEDRLQHEKMCYEIISRRLPGDLADELSQAVASLEQFVSS